MTISLRAKLMLSFVLVVLICGIIATWVGVRLINNKIVSQAQDKVRVDLNSAREIYEVHSNKVKDVVKFTATRFFLRDGLERNRRDMIRSELQKIRLDESLDIFLLTDAQGSVLFRANNPENSGDNKADNALIARVMRRRALVSSTEIMSMEELSIEGDDLAARAHIELEKIAGTEVRTQSHLKGGMVINAAAPVFDEHGGLLGILYGGILVNRNYEIVDKVKQTVYQDELYEGREIGAATIFQGDVRISTGVTRNSGERAIGTLMSDEVFTQVLVQGKPWIDRAFVVENWYITSYEPIRNSSEKIIGVLAVGMLEEKFSDMKRYTVWTFLGIAFAGIVAALVVSYFLADGIIKPVTRLVMASQHLAQGDLTYKVDVKTKDEIGKLGATFNFMAGALKDRDEQLKRRAQDTIMQSERLATIGQLAAGVAHEMNNPLGGILLYANLLLEKSADEDPQKEDLQRIVHETERCRKIVRGLLDFSRQTKLEMNVVDLNRIIEKTLELLITQTIFKNIEVSREFAPNLPTVLIDVGQMQQVFINILFNAAEALEGEGKLKVTTAHDREDGCVKVIFEDDGPGISQENIQNIFDPFFTTKPIGKGTGLGLSIAFGIVRKHSGSIEVASEVGAGCIFTIKLPVMSSGENS